MTAVYEEYSKDKPKVILSNLLRYIIETEVKNCLKEKFEEIEDYYCDKMGPKKKRNNLGF